MASLTRWTWVWASSGSWWWMRKPGVLQSMQLQRVRHDWVTELTEKPQMWGDTWIKSTPELKGLLGSSVKNLPAMWKIWIPSLGQEDPLEERMATRSSITCRIPWTEDPGRLQSMGLQRAGHNWAILSLLATWRLAVEDTKKPANVKIWMQEE